ncbi:putative phage tail fiber protein [Escherichia coli BCE030_MS-09]|nr:putative phage tail fiber protein [Escherichia coli BCE030_MS-09]
MTEDDARPEALRRFELMVEEVARNAPRGTEHGSREEVSQDASTSAREAATLRLMLQASTAPARQPDRPLVGSVSVFQRRNGIDKGQ